MPAATRIGDADLPHCSGMVRAEGSRDVFINSIPHSRLGDSNTPHKLPGDPCPIHSAPIAEGSRTVFVMEKQQEELVILLRGAQQSQKDHVMYSLVVKSTY